MEPVFRMNQYRAEIKENQKNDANDVSKSDADDADGVNDTYERNAMNIQIFGTKKSRDSQKAERFFKERGIRFQYVDMKQKGLSKGELESVCRAVGGLDAMIDPECRDKDLLALIRYIAEEDRAEKVLENLSVLKLPIVRNRRQATVGYQPEVWKSWA